MRHAPLASLIALLLSFASLSALFVTSAQQQGEQSRQLVIEPIKQLPSKEKRYALVIGVDAYDDAQISRLGGAANDAKALASALVQYAGFPESQVTLLASDQPVQRRPTRRTILRYLANLRGSVPRDGLLLVSFAGHGIERGGRAYLLPADAEGTDDISLLEDTAIGVDRVKESIRATGVGQVMLVLDACRNDPTAGRSGGDNAMTASFSRSFNFNVRNREVNAFVTLYATAVGHRAYEYAEKGQGYFTYALVEAMRGGAANSEGEVTLGGLLRYVQDTVPQFVRRDLGANKEQRPFAVIEGYRADELVLAVANRAGPSAIASLPPAPKGFDPAAFELEFWNAIKNSSDPQEYRDYLEKYPNGQFAALARRRANPPSGAATPAQPAPTTATPTRAVTTQAGIEFVYIPAGTFRMGSDNGESDEKPVHEVTIRDGFYMGKYEVTQGQWERVMGTSVRQQRDKADPKFVTRGEGANYPMYYVSWEDAQAFVRQLNAQNDGYTYRLPTEAEWEYACRAGATGDYAGVLDTMAWYGNNSGKSYLDADAIWRTDKDNYIKRVVTDNEAQTHPVGTKTPNVFGLHDMHGNVWEWCEDWYHDSYNGAPSDGSAWLSGGEQKYRLLRGGSWNDDSALLRSANRSWVAPGDRNYGYGFRVVAVSRT